MFYRTKTQYKISDFKEYFGFQFIVVWRQRLSDLVNCERFDGFRRGYISVEKKTDNCDAAKTQRIKTNLPGCILRSTFTNVLDDHAVIFDSFIRFGMVLIVLDLLPPNSSRHNEIAFKLVVRDTAMLFQKSINRLGKILVGLSDCWIETEQLHKKILSRPSEMSLYQLMRHFSDRKVEHATELCTTTNMSGLRQLVRWCLGREWR